MTVLTPKIKHENSSHAHEHSHHHHDHSPSSHHSGGHHLLQVEDLNISFMIYDNGINRQLPGKVRHYFSARQQQVKIIHNLHIGVHAGEIIAIVGASGSGKTLLADSLMGHFQPNATVTGRIWFDGQEMNASSLKELRGRGISLVPQSVNYLDPLIKVGRQVQGFAARRAQLRAEPDRYSQEEKDSGSFAAQRAQLQAELFARYNLGTEVANLYPFELSGGMSRRVLLCCALIDNPRVIIADEPTPGLDLDLAKVALADFRKFANDGGGVLLITHDIELALSVADRVAVFNNGTIVEETAVANFASPLTLKHPFSKALWHALPEHDFSLNPSGED